MNGEGLAAFTPQPRDRDYCSREGALAIKANIESYWRERGFHVQIMLQSHGFDPSMRSARFDVRSDMLNGMPRAAPE